MQPLRCACTCCAVVALSQPLTFLKQCIWKARLSRTTTICVRPVVGCTRSAVCSVFNAQTVRSDLSDRTGCRETGWDIDCIVPVPDGSRPAAIQMSAELGLPYREGLVKNRYVGRTFIMPDQVRNSLYEAVMTKLCDVEMRA